MKNWFLSFILLFILTSCMSQKKVITEQNIFETFIKSKELIEHFKYQKEIYILRDKNLCEKIDCDKSYNSYDKIVNIWGKADYFSRALRDYVVIKTFDKKNNKVDFFFHK